MRTASYKLKMELGELIGLPFSAREVEIIRLVLSGKVTGNEIGRALFITEFGARSHLSNIYTKMNATNLAEVVLMVLGRIPCPVDLAPYKFTEEP
jgi:DNA-binding CsgD family transcriptional regulator